MKKSAEQKRREQQQREQKPGVTHVGGDDLPISEEIKKPSREGNRHAITPGWSRRSVYWLANKPAIYKWEAAKWIGTLLLLIAWFLQNKLIPDIKADIDNRQATISGIQTYEINKSISTTQVASAIADTSNTKVSSDNKRDWLFADANFATIMLHLSEEAIIKDLHGDSPAIVQMKWAPKYALITTLRDSNDINGLHKEDVSLNNELHKVGVERKATAAQRIAEEHTKMNGMTPLFYSLYIIGSILLFLQFVITTIAPRKK